VPLQATICLTGRGIENIDGGLGKLGGSLHRVLPARSEMVTTLIAQILRFARPNIQIYDARVVDLYQWVCALYLVGVKGAETKAVAEREGFEPTVRFRPSGAFNYRTPALVATRIGVTKSN
jgi:maltoporin